MSEAAQFSTALGTSKAEIDAHLSTFFATTIPNIGMPLSEEGAWAWHSLRGFSALPGKRLRGAVAMQGYEMVGGANHDTALDLAAAVELTQDYLLDIDDVMDRSESRRGGLTLWRQYFERLESRNPRQDRLHLANMAAINVGLIAREVAGGILASLPETPDKVVAAMQLYHRNLGATGLGQLDDLLNVGANPDLDAIRNMYVLKSSYYSFINPLQLGIALAGGTDKDLEAAQEYGECVGVEFQCLDDVLGMYGDEAETGKSTLDDLREGKRTMLMQHALKHGTPADIEHIHRALGNPEVTPRQHATIKAILKRIGSLAYVTDLAKQEADKALAILEEQTGWNEKNKAFLRGLVQYILERTY